MVSNWDELRQRIYDKQDITLFDEAIKCLEAKAYRMSYIASWVAIAESLKNKFKLMAERDKFADEIVKKVEEVENKHSPPDRFILDKAKEIGILDEVSFKQIEPILTMRNLFAHPYNIGPMEDEVCLAIKLAVDKILSVPPLLRKPYIDDLLENLQKNRHYIDDLEEKVVKFAGDITDRIAPTLYPYFLKCLLFRLNEVIDDPDKRIFADRLIWFAQSFIKHNNPDFSNSKWALKEKCNDFPKAVSKIFATIELWGLIPEDIQDSVTSYLLFPEKDGKLIAPEPWAIKRIFLLFINKKLSSRQEERFKDRWESIKAADAMQAGIPLDYYGDKIIESLSSHDWYIQNPAAILLWNLGPEDMENVHADMLESLGRNILQSADGNAGGSISFLVKTLETSIKWPESFVKGLLYECFLNEKKEFRCKDTHVDKAILIAIRCNKESPMFLIDALLEDIDKSKPKHEIPIFLKIQETAEGVNKAIQNLNNGEKIIFEDKLNRLIRKLEEIKNALESKE